MDFRVVATGSEIWKVMRGNSDALCEPPCQRVVS